MFITQSDKVAHLRGHLNPMVNKYCNDATSILFLVLIRELINLYVMFFFSILFLMLKL